MNHHANIPKDEMLSAATPEHNGGTDAPDASSLNLDISVLMDRDGAANYEAIMESVFLIKRRKNRSAGISRKSGSGRTFISAGYYGRMESGQTGN